MMSRFLQVEMAKSLPSPPPPNSPQLYPLLFSILLGLLYSQKEGLARNRTLQQKESSEGLARNLNYY